MDQVNLDLDLGKNVGLDDTGFFGRLTRYAIMTFVVILALAQMDIGGEILRNAFYILFGAVCLALASAARNGPVRRWSACFTTAVARNRNPELQSGVRNTVAD